MKRFVRLMLHFFIGLEVSWRRANIFWYGRVIKTDYSFICKHRETVEAKIIASKPLQRSHCISYLQLFQLYFYLLSIQIDDSLETLSLSQNVQKQITGLSI